MSTGNSYDKRGDILNLRNDGTVISLGDDDKISIGKSGYYFLTGIVSEVLENPDIMLNQKVDEDDEDSILLKNKLEEDVSFPMRTKIISKNSIVAYILDEARAVTGELPVVCLPFFGSHFSLPIKPGEHVWILAEEFRGRSFYYWMSKKGSFGQIEDANFTVSQRAESVEVAIADIVKSETNKIELEKAVSDLYDYEEYDDQENLPEEINTVSITKDSISFKQKFTREPVPSVEKKCGDLLLQGSNNSFFHLTTEKFTEPSECQNLYRKDLFASDQTKILNKNRIPSSPAIDMCIFKNKADIQQLSEADYTQTILESDNMSLVKNSLGFFENEKSQLMRKDFVDFKDDTIENSPLNCGARIYMSNNCQIDDICSINFNDLSNNHGSSLLIYSDYSRILANKNYKLIVGDVVAAKENNNDDNISYIEIKGGEDENNQSKNGNIIIKPNSQKHIYLGSYDASESGVLGDKLVSILTELIDAILQSTVATAVGPSGPISGGAGAVGLEAAKSRLEEIKSTLVKIK